MPNQDKLSVVVSVIVLCLALSLIAKWPPESLSLGTSPAARFSIVILGSPSTTLFSQNWLAVVLLASMACVGTASIVRLHPQSRESNVPHPFVASILPTFATMLAAVLLPRVSGPLYTLVGLAVTGVLLLLMITAEYRVIDPSDSGYRAARLGLNFIAYLVALVCFTLIQDTDVHGFLAAAASLAVSALLSLDLLHDTWQGLRRTGLYALIVGLVMGEIVWALSFLPLNSPLLDPRAHPSSLAARGALPILLLLAFYVLTGLARQGMLRLLSRRILVEFAVVALIGLAMLLRNR